MSEETILIDVEIDDNTASEKLRNLSSLFAANTRQIQENKKAMKELDKQLKDGTISQEQYGKQMILLKASNSELTAQNNELVKSGRAIVSATEEQTNSMINAGGSIAAMRREVTSLQQQYAQLTKAERESAGGKEMLKKLQELEDETRTAEMEMRNFKTTIGNYPTSIASLVPGFNQLSGIIRSIGVDINTLAQGGTKGFASVATAAKAMGKAFITPPLGVVVAVLGAIVLAVQGVVSAFKKNDDATTRLQAAIAKFRPVLTAIGKVFDIVAQAVAKFVEWIVDAATWMIKMNPIAKAFNALFPSAAKGMEEESEAARNLVIEQDKLEDKEREYTENKAKRESEVAKLRVDALDKEKYSASERKTMIAKAIELERKNLEDEKEIAKKRLELFDQEAKANNDTSDEMKNKRAELVAALYKADESYYTGTRRLQSQLQASIKEIDDEDKKLVEERKKRAEEWQRTVKERAERALSYERELEDALVNAMQEGAEKQIRIAELQTSRDIAEIRKRLKEEKGLTQKEREILNKLIEEKEKELQKTISDIRATADAENVRRAIDAETEKLNLEIAAYKSRDDEYYGLRAKALERQMQLELSVEGLTEQEKLNIAEKYRLQYEALEDEKRREFMKRKMESISLEYEQRILLLGDNERAIADEEVLIEQDKLARLESLDAESKARMFASEQEYTNAVIAQRNAVEKATKNAIEAQYSYAQQQVENAQSILDSMENVFNELGADTKAFAVFQKLTALAQASISLGKAIAEATAAATAGDPYTVAIRVAAAVASVTSAFVSVIASIKNAQVPDSPKFAEGGVVGGSSYSGDRVKASVNSGEMILTRQQQARLFEIANGGGIAGNIDAMRIAMTEAVSSMPAPTMVYTEFEDFTKRINKIRNYENI